jgi:hypothetical protein
MLSIFKSKAGPETPDEDSEEKKEREIRRRESERRVLDVIARARRTREANKEAERKHNATVMRKRAETDSAIDEVQQKASEISGVFNPKNGKSVEEVAEEALADEEAGATD